MPKSCLVLTLFTAQDGRKTTVYTSMKAIVVLSYGRWNIWLESMVSWARRKSGSISSVSR